MNIHTPVTGKSARIRELNDALRRTFVGGTIMVTSAFEALDAELKARALQRVRTFNDFNADNDPYDEHDCFLFDEGGERFAAKVDYYSPDMRTGSDDPSDPDKTRRVLTIMLASDM